MNGTPGPAVCHRRFCGGAGQSPLMAGGNYSFCLVGESPTLPQEGISRGANPWLFSRTDKINVTSAVTICRDNSKSLYWIFINESEGIGIGLILSRTVSCLKKKKGAPRTTEEGRDPQQGTQAEHLTAENMSRANSKLTLTRAD